MPTFDAIDVETANAEAPEVQARATRVRESLAAVREELSESVVRSPAAGEVFDMAVFTPREVHIRTGERSPLSYLAQPLTDCFSRGLRED